MTSKPFKLDMVALLPFFDAEGGDVEAVARNGLDALADQLRDHGAPDAPIEEQLRALLASHRALQEAGEEMPDNLIALVSDRNGIAHGADVLTTKAILVPLFARLTQERDEAQENAKRGWNAAHEDVEVMNALRQRAERAERIALERQTEAREATAAAVGHYVEVQRLRARIAELEATREPGVDVVEKMADVYFETSQVMVSLKGIRAVISHLAAMGEETWPTNEQVYYAWFVNSVREFEGHTDHWTPHIERVRELFRVSTAPVLGALRARVAELESAAEELHPGCTCKPSSGCPFARLQEIIKTERKS